MDLTSALNNLECAIASLNSFPRFKSALKSSHKLIPSSTLLMAQESALASCIPLLARIAADAKNKLASFDTSRIERVRQRKQFINKCMKEREEEIKNQNEKERIVEEIEVLERQSIIKHKEIIVKQKIADEIIKNIHEGIEIKENKRLEPILRQVIKLEYDKVSEKEKEIYKMIMELIKSESNL